MQPKDFAFLQSILSFWDHLKKAEQDYLLQNVISIQYKKGTLIHQSGEDCLGLLLIQHGELRIHMLSEDGRDITLYRLPKENICVLSASCVLKNIDFQVHISAETDCTVLLLNAPAFQYLYGQNIYVENFTAQIAIRRFSDVMWAMQQILFKSLDRRLAGFLLKETAEKQTSTLHLSHETIAKYIGSAREVVSRMLKYFAAEGLVSLSRGEVTILNRTGLESLSDAQHR